MKVVIVEDSAPVRVQLRQLLGLTPGVEVIGEAVSEDGAIETIARLRPDAVLLDLRLAPGSGINVLRTLNARGVQTRTLVLSNETDPRYKALCLELGALGFFDKSLEMKAALEQLRAWCADLAKGDGTPR